MQSKRRILFPFLALLLTTIAFALVLFSIFISNPVFIRLLQGSSGSFYLLPTWLRYCLLHPALLKTLTRAGFGFSVLGSMLTFLLLLKTEPPTVAYRSLAGIGWAVLLMTGLFSGLALGATYFPLIPAIVRGGGTGQLTRLLLSFLPVVPILCALFLVVITIPFSFVKIIGRLRASAPARQSPHVLQ